MAPLASKGKSKGKEGMQSRSRNTTPSSVVSVAISSTGPPKTNYLDIPTEHLVIPATISYDDILEKHGGAGGIPDPKHLEALANDLKTLSSWAEVRGQHCDGGMRELSDRRKEREREEREREQANREAEEKESLKRAAEDDEESKARKGGKLKKRKDRSSIREERPLTHGAHGVARQDGVGVISKASSKSPKMPEARPTQVLEPSPSKQRTKNTSGSSSSLSPTSQIQSPTTIQNTNAVFDTSRASPTPSTSSLDSHQPLPAPSIMQHQIFGADPLTFDDPTIYHIREVTDDMTDDQKKEIYGVTQFPHDDLSHLIAGVPPDKDFSNAKPTNQVNANTFAAYLEPYVRPLVEEDMAFLRERGDRVTPFLMPRRGKKHYTEVWAEEDGSVSVDIPENANNKLPPNQPRGNLEQMDDDTTETDQISAGPLLNRLLSTMRPERRVATSEEKEKVNGMVNGNGEPSMNGYSNGEMNGDATTETIVDDNSDRLPAATFMPESTSQGWKVPPPKLDYAQYDERLKMELRHIGFLPPDTEPDYDAHYDDEVGERIRFLQSELKKQMIVNGARKARIAQIAEEYLAHQEFSNIVADLDTQVDQAYLKRSRTLGKGKKNTKRPGGAGGGSHYVVGPLASGSTGVTKPGIGDVARTVMERRKNWIDTIKPVFDEDVTRVRTEGEGIFEGPEWEKLLATEKERWDEEAE